jgi:hypothetical protein
VRIAGTVLVACLLACSARAPDTSGVGPYVLGSTKLADGEVNARCQPTDELTWCFGSPQIALGAQSATVDLYFGGHGKDAPLVEIVLAVRSCQVPVVEAALDKAIGAASESGPKRRVWSRRSAFILAKLPGSGTTCEVYFVAPSDKKRIAALRSET